MKYVRLRRQISHVLEFSYVEFTHSNVGVCAHVCSRNVQRGLFMGRKEATREGEKFQLHH